MIRYLGDNEKGKSEELYRAAFPEDKDAFVEYYYSYVIKDNKILVLEQDDKICSMLHLNPYCQSVQGTVVDAYYYVAVATREDYRHRGMMRKLLMKSLNDIHVEGHPYTYLMPANRAIYEPFDFRIVYEQKKVELPLDPQKANEKMAEMFDIYTLRDDWYVEKMLEEERVCAGDPPFEIVPYIMMRITHVEKMLELLRSEKSCKVVLDVQDEIIPGNHGRFLWEVTSSNSTCKRVDILKDMVSDTFAKMEVVKLTIAELTEFVFGKRTITGLEDVKVLKNICINEAV